MCLPAQSLTDAIVDVTAIHNHAGNIADYVLDSGFLAAKVGPTLPRANTT